jgi:hypothetical protein
VITPLEGTPIVLSCLGFVASGGSLRKGRYASVQCVRAFGFRGVVCGAEWVFCGGVFWARFPRILTLSVAFAATSLGFSICSA